MKFDHSDPIWKILAAIDDEPTGEFRNLVEAAKLDPKEDFHDACLAGLPLNGADISGFNFSGSDLRGTGLRHTVKFDDVTISNDTKLDPVDQKWWNRRKRTAWRRLMADASASARGSSFNAAMRILSRPRREAMFEIYAFCRAVDDIADETGPREDRSQALAEWRRDIGALYTGGNEQTRTPARLRGLAMAIRAFGLRREDFSAVIDGVEMDVLSDIKAPDFATLDLYCDRVASAVGRLSARAFGMPQAEGQELAYHLGRALQLTNILRDLDEDAALSRLYLPSEDLREAGIEEEEPRKVLASPDLARACAPTIGRAKAHFVKARQIMARCPRASVRAPRIMADVYFAILTSLERRGFAAPRKRVRSPRLRLALALLRYGLL